MALIALYHEKLVIKTWMTFVVYQVFNLATASIVAFANFAIPALNRFSRMFISVLFRVEYPLIVY
jgi:choline transport protein